jgi:hypothetical protein
VIEANPDQPLKGPQQQGGVRFRTLCGSCNSYMGHYYVPSYVAWTHQAAEILYRSHGNPRLTHVHHLFPLRCLKQVAAMFFSVNGEGFGAANPELVQFVCARFSGNLSPRYRFFMYYSVGGGLRYYGLSGIANVHTGSIITASEINFPPFGFVLAIDSQPPDERLFEITHFSGFGFDEFRSLATCPPALVTRRWYPGSYDVP